MIRLQRVGKKKQPTYRLVISEKARDTQAKALEILGHYSPTQNPKVLELKADRIKHWISMGAQASETVNNLLIREGVIEGKKAKSVSLTKKRRGKIDAKKAEADQKVKDAEEAKKAEAEAKAAEKKAAAEAPKEEISKEKPAEETPAEEEKTKE